MSIPAGSILTVAGLNVVDRLQDAGLQNPKVPTETVRETGNDLVVGKVLTEADFTFQLTSWDTNCDMMAMLLGKLGTIGEGPSAKDAKGTIYDWENVGFVNIASPWKTDTGTAGGDIGSGVIIPAYFPTALSYKFGVKAMAEQAVTLRGGAYFMNFGGYPIEETAVGNGVIVTFESKEPANVLRVGGHGSTEYQHVFGVMVNGVIQLPGVDYIEESGAAPEAEGGMTKVKVKFAVAPPEGAVVRFMYFSTTPHKLDQTVHESTVISPAAVRGRDIDVYLGGPGSTVKIHGVQDFSLAASISGEIQREMGTYDPIGFASTGTDANGSITLEPQTQETFYDTLAEMIGIDKSEVMGYINQYPVPLTVAINNPAKRGEILKSIYVPDAIFQTPGSTVKVNTVSQFPITWEGLEGTFREIKGELPK